MPPGSGRAGARREGRVEDVDVDRVRKTGPVACRPRPLARPRRRCPDRATSCMKSAGDPVLALPGELRLARPVAAQADLHVALADPRAPARPAGTSACRGRARPRRPRLPVSVWVSKWTSPTRPVRGRAGAACPARRSSGRRRARSGIAPASTTSPTSALDRRRAVRGRVGRDAPAASPKSTTRSSAKPVDPGLEVRAGRRSSRRGSRAARSASPGRSETRSSVGAPRIDHVRRRPVRPGPRCRACRRRSRGRRSRVSRRRRATA